MTAVRSRRGVAARPDEAAATGAAAAATMDVAVAVMVVAAMTRRRRVMRRGEAAWPFARRVMTAVRSRRGAAARPDEAVGRGEAVRTLAEA